MSFIALVYHELREKAMLRPGQSSPIDVGQDYDDSLPAPLFNTLENFEVQMAYLSENGFHILTLPEIIRYYYGQTALPEKSVLLTFDDCYQSMALYAYPVLKKYRFHAVAFVVTGWLNTHHMPFDPARSVCLTEIDLYSMTDVFEYANHTDRFHTRSDEQTSILMTAGDNEFAEDLRRCSANPLIRSKDVFAYPFDLYSGRNTDLLRKLGFKLAFTCKDGRNGREDNPLLLKRNVIAYFMEPQAFRDIVG